MVAIVYLGKIVSAHPLILTHRSRFHVTTFFSLTCLKVRAVTTQSLKSCSKSDQIKDPTTMTQQSARSDNGSAASDKTSSKVSPSEKYRLRSRPIASKTDTGKSRPIASKTDTERSRPVASKIDTGRSRHSEKTVDQNDQLPVVEVKTPTNRRDNFVKFFDVFVHLFQVQH